MWRIPIHQITYETVRDFCEQRIAEGPQLDYGLDLRKDIAKTMCAFANTQGGLLILGVEDDKDNRPVLPIAGVESKRGLREQVVSKAYDAIAPPVFPEVQVCEFAHEQTGDQRAIIVVRVDQSDAGPHAMDQGRRAYVRLDDQSRPEQLATMAQLSWLMERRQRSMDLRERVWEHMRRHAAVALGFGPAKLDIPCYRLLGTPVFPTGPLASREQLLQLVERVKASPGWAPYSTGEMFARPVGGGACVGPLRSQPSRWYAEVNENGLVICVEHVARDSEVAPPHLDKAVRLLCHWLSRLGEIWRDVGFFGPGLVRFERTAVETNVGLDWDGPKDRYGEYYCPDEIVTVEREVLAREVADALPAMAADILTEFAWAFGRKLSGKEAEDHVSRVRGSP